MTDLPLDRMARKASAEPFFLGHRLAEYARVHELDDATLAARLGCPPELLAAVRLCRAPRAPREEFREDVLCVAAKFGLNVPALADTAKYAPPSPRGAEQPAEPAAIVLAARDRETPS